MKYRATTLADVTNVRTDSDTDHAERILLCILAESTAEAVYYVKGLLERMALVPPPAGVALSLEGLICQQPGIPPDGEVCSKCILHCTLGGGGPCNIQASWSRASMKVCAQNQ
jgi:hypothetical protein